MTKDINDLQRISSVEIARLSLLRTDPYNLSPEEKKINSERLRDLYVIFLKTAKQKPEFSLKKTLSVFRYLTRNADPEFAKQIDADYKQLREIGVENPFHYEYQKENEFRIL
jgi:hypothetical protein